MPLDIHVCRDTAVEQAAKEAEQSKTWVPGFAQDIYHDLFDKHPTYAPGTDKCGALPAIDLSDWNIQRTEIVTNPSTNHLILLLPRVGLQLPITGPLRVDEMERKSAHMVLEPGYIKPGLPNGSMETDGHQMFSWHDRSGRMQVLPLYDQQYIIEDGSKK